jgi:hypothetical protein
MVHTDRYGVRAADAVQLAAALVWSLNVLLRRSTFDKRYPQSGRIRGHRGSREGVQDGYAGGLVVGHVAGHHGEAVYQCRRRDLLVQRILRMWNPQPPPYLRDLRIEGEDRVSVLPGDRAEPTRQASRPRDVATMAHSLNALTQLADRNRREEQRDALRRSIPKEPTNAGLARVRLRALLMTSVSTRYMCRPHARRSVCGARSRRLRRRRASPRALRRASGAWGATAPARGFPDVPARRCDSAGRRAS